ncbi:adhesion protein [Pseudomonas aeruginosa VRFPA02]|nr:adhesion protein [Pseudomonas aeruginosa VRFPA02]
MSVETVRPAGAGHETLYVLLGSVLILALAATVVGLRQQSHEAQALDAHQVDARLDLNAAEQGIYADLQVAAEDIQARLDDGEAAPSVDELAAEGFPPFVADVAASSRGGPLPTPYRATPAPWLTPLAPGGQPLRRRRDPSAPPLIAHRLHRRRFSMLFSRRSSRPRGLAALLPGRALLAALLLALLAPLAQAEDGKRLRIGITLHPYYSYVSNIVGDQAEVVPLIPAGFNPHAYEPRAEDIKRIGTLDVVVLNGVGHDDFAERMIASSEKPGIPVIEANAKVPLLAATGMAARGAGKVVNPHTFLSISASITQVNTIARELGKLDPANAKAYTRNARAYAKRLRALRADALARLNKAPAADFRVATIHGAYDYLLREFGLEVTAVVEPAHGIEPSPSQLKKTIDQLKALDVKVIFSEIDFPSTYVETIQRESGVKLYSLSHISYGDYSAGKYEEEMARNLDTVVRAIQESGA